MLIFYLVSRSASLATRDSRISSITGRCSDNFGGNVKKLLRPNKLIYAFSAMFDKEVELESVFGVSIPGFVDLGFIEAVKNRGNFN